jgi:DHA2 family multidrug resistance protein-like MFS transporter
LPPQVASQLIALAHGAFDQAFVAVMVVAVLIVVAAAGSVAALGWLAKNKPQQRQAPSAQAGTRTRPDCP